MPREEPMTTEDLENACDQLRLMAFPPPESSRAALMNELSNMCPHKRALKWLIAELVNHISKWPGLAEVRGLLCQKFDPADGVDQWCTLPGYTPEEMEDKYLERHKQLKEGEGYIADETREQLRLMEAKLKQIPAGRKPS